MQLHTRPGDMRYEPFSGSLQLIAGERRAGKFLDWLCPKPSVMMSSGAGRNSPARRLRLMATAAASVKSPPERVPKGKNVAAASTNAHYVFGRRTNQGRGWRRDHSRDAHRGVSSPGSPRPWPRTWPSAPSLPWWRVPAAIFSQAFLWSGETEAAGVTRNPRLPWPSGRCVTEVSFPGALGRRSRIHDPQACEHETTIEF